jgi:hypothetical protein
MTTTLPAPETMAEVLSGVTETMLGLAFRPVPEAPWSHLVWRAAVLPIPGAFPFTVGLSSDRTGCQALGSRMFQVPVAEVSDEMLSDSLCELVNMTAGLLKGRLHLQQALGLPKVVTEHKPPLSPPPPHAGRIVLRADALGLVLWIFEGLL